MTTILEPSDELDRKAAEVVLGWTDWREDHRGSVVKPPGEDSRQFKPSLRIEDAFELVDKVLEVCRGQMRLQRGHSRWTSVTFYGKHGDEELMYAFGTQKTEALAICEAAIEAMAKHNEIMAGLAKLEREEA
jgi:hypothetical protein